MSCCESCGGVIGRDCFNPQECMEITRQQAMALREQPGSYVELGIENELLEEKVKSLRETIAEFQWKRRPTTAGAYVCWSGWKSQFPLTALFLNDEQVARGAPFGVVAVLGPLPAMPCEQCHGLGTPPGEAAGLVCGACNGSGIDNDEEID